MRGVGIPGPTAGEPWLRFGSVRRAVSSRPVWDVTHNPPPSADAGKHPEQPARHHVFFSGGDTTYNNFSASSECLSPAPVTSCRSPWGGPAGEESGEAARSQTEEGCQRLQAESPQGHTASRLPTPHSPSPRRPANAASRGRRTPPWSSPLSTGNLSQQTSWRRCWTACLFAWKCIKWCK